MKILIVSLRYLGDCLLAAALAPAIKEKLPDAQVDLLTFKDNRGILEGISAIDNVIGVEHHPNKFRQALDHLRSWNSYDWALSRMNNTRATLYCWSSAKRQIMPPSSELWIRALITNFTRPAPGHMLDILSALAEPVLGANAVIRPVAPDAELSEDLRNELTRLGPYIACHPCSRYQDKNWSISGWKKLLQETINAGYGICLTGGPGETEKNYIQSITEDLPQEKLCIIAGRASFGQTGRAIREARAYVGVDTATTHVAAATGTPCIALFGSTSVETWGPAPQSGLPHNFSNMLDLQTIGNTTIVRRDNPEPCSGCRSHNHLCAHFTPPELSRCMQSIPAEKVWRALSNVL